VGVVMSVVKIQVLVCIPKLELGNEEKEGKKIGCGNA